MPEDVTVTRKNRVRSGNLENKDYTATEELHFEDFEAVARAVLRQRKISETVSKHLTPQFEEYELAENNKRDLKREEVITSSAPATKTASKQTNNPSTEPEYNQITIDSDVFESILIGLAQLVDSQRRFADEFGLKQELVFTSNTKDIQQHGSTSVLYDWLKGKKPNASSKLDALFEDLVHHQAGPLASLDTISRRTIRYLGSELTEKNVHGLARLGSMWSHYKKRNMKIAGDEHARYKIIIAPGVSYAYSTAKEKLIKKE